MNKMNYGINRYWKTGLLLLILLLFIFLLKKYQGVFVFLFSRFWGHVILFLFVFFVSLYHYFYGIILGLVFILIGLIVHLGYVSGLREGLDAGVGGSDEGYGYGDGDGHRYGHRYGYRGMGSWPSSLVDDFQSYQATYLPQYSFDMAMLQKQAAPWEVEALLRDGVWPWSDEVKKMYREYVAENWFVSVDPGEALNNAMSVYNQAAIVQMMALNSKEGSFLLNGVINGHTEGVPANKGNVVVCDSGDANTSRMVQKKVVGFSGIWGNLIVDESPVDDADLPAVVPGFSFINEGGACNPCGALGSVPDYSCAYRLNVGDGGEVSPIWKMLWSGDGRK